MANAPVCFVSVNEQINQPPGASLPALPVATDLSSALAALTAMRQMLLQLTGQVGGLPPSGEQQGLQGPAGPAASKQQQRAARYKQINSVTKQVELKSDDGSVTFTLNQTVSVTMQDTVTGVQFTINNPNVVDSGA